MTHPAVRPFLREDQRRQICSLLSAGCDRETATKCVGCSIADMQREMMRDASFAVDVQRAEGLSELTHIRALQKAAEDVKNWRVSIWWLERRSPKRFARRNAGSITSRQLEHFMAQLVLLVNEAIHDASILEQLVTGLEKITRVLGEPDLQNLPLGNVSVPENHSQFTRESDEVDFEDPST